MVAVEARRAGGGTRGRSGGLSPARCVALVAVAVWLVVPLALHGHHAQDGIPSAVAADLLDEAPDAVYPDGDEGIFTPDPVFRERSCAFYETQEKCDDLAVAFVSTPATLPLIAPLARLADDWAVTVVRVLGAAALVAAFAMLWRDHRDRLSGELAAAALLLVPLAVVTVAIGQTSPLLFLAAALGPPGRDRRGVAAGVAWVLAIAFKAFPAVLAVVLLVRGRVREAAWCAGAVLGLLGMAVLLAPDVVGSYPEALGAIASDTTASGYDAALPGTLGWLVRVAAVVAMVWVARRAPDDRSAWRAGGALAILATPQLWYHYLWFAFPATLDAATRGVALRRLPVVAAAVLGVLAFPVPARTELVLVAAVAVAFFGSWTPTVGVERPKNDGVAPAGSR